MEIISPNKADDTKDNQTTDVESYRMNHTMIRVKDVKKSIDFYSNILGMQLVNDFELPGAGASLYFLSYGDMKSKGGQPNCEGLLELTHNHGSENDASFKYHNGNDQPQGFGHTCISVDDIDAACARFEKLGVQWKKRLTDGRMKSIAFVLDPDNYWVEVIQNSALKSKA